MKCMMDHIVLNVRDEAAMIGFYTEVLLFAPERLEAYRQGQVPFPSVRMNCDTVIDLFPPTMWKGVSTASDGAGHLNHFCIALSRGDWEQLTVRLEANQVEIDDGPVPRWGAHGTGTSIYFRDPDGNVIEARYYEGQYNAAKCLLGS